MGAALQLERFDPPPPAPLPALHSAEELQDAYLHGMIAGREQVMAEQAGQMQAALSAISAELADLHAALAEGGRAHARALEPLVSALLEGLLPAAARARLQADVRGTLAHLAGAVMPLGIKIRCGTDLAAFMRSCAGEAGIGAIEIAADGPDGTVTAELLGGTMAWDEARVVAQLRALVQEIMEEQ
ncbi:hypothetical protein [Paracoccus contaminans]|uniref:Flagellar assembly protein FliH/Type III secretion system HrpE domain-containing protein n=1 Tax=Paracoccus contaminans TaxID=1945662 RepID=A0A1W6CVS3_9RHOB|nr:hypothetical protein [Paracoccus contaminans]ARJ68925.1 hypothetical protein B0A89_04045 [Paracoccus contaminans]